MTVEATPRKAGPFDGNGITVSFPFDFKIFAKTDLRVVRTNAAAVEDDLVLDSDYTVDMNIDQDATPGGTVEYDGPPILPAGWKLTILGATPYNQVTDITNVGRFNPNVIEQTLDRNTIQVQQLAEGLTRAVQVPVSSDSTPETLIDDLIGAAADAEAAAGAAAGSAADAATQAGSAAAAAVAAGLEADSAADEAIAAAASAAAASGAAVVQVNLYRTEVANAANVALGAALMGYLPNYAGAVGATLADVLDERVSMKRFGLRTTNTGAQNVTAWNAAIAYAITQGGMTLHIPRGTYDFNGTLSMVGANNVRISGDGPDATILRITHATANFISATGETSYQTFDNFSLTSTVTRTAGAMMKLGTGALGLWKRGLVHRVRIQQHFNGIDTPGFEQSTLSEVFIVRPSGAGSSLICGVAAASNQGANLNILNCFGRGNDDITNDDPTGLTAMLLYDIEAVFVVNSDFANYKNQIMVVEPTTRCANCHFVQTYFDGTKLGDNVLMQGAGIKQQFQFTGCWFNGAGRHGAGAVDAYGVNALGAGEYFDINFTGCRWLSHSGSQFVSRSTWLDFNFVGCVFVNPGLNAGSTQRHSMLFDPTGTVVKWPIITGCKYEGTPVGASNIVCTGNASTNMVISGSNLDRGLVKPSTAYFGRVQGNYDALASAGVASASSIIIPSTIDYVVISGTTTINEIRPTWPGHKVSLRFTGALTVADDAGNLRLVGNYVTTGNSVLTLVCEANGDWREVARATS